MEIYQAGLDVSRYQGKIDWRRVAEEGKQFAIIRAVSSDASDTPYEDPRFAENIREAVRAGLRVGAYYYTCATTLAYAEQELSVVRRVLAGHQLQYPVFLNVEDDTLRLPGRKKLTALVLHALRGLRTAGYYPGVYSNTDFLMACLDRKALREYPLFLADYSAIAGCDSTYQMLQYTDEGVVRGIDERVDLDAAYVDFLPFIQARGLNNYTPTDTPVPMVQLANFRLAVYGEEACLCYRTADVSDKATRLQAGSYPALSQTARCYNGRCWAVVRTEGKMRWVPLLADRCYLTQMEKNDCAP